MPIELRRSSSPRVSIIIPASSVSPLLFACLRSLERFAPRDIPYETIVVLNRSSGEEAARVWAEVTGVEVVWSPINLGLAGAGNRGRSLARGDLIVLLHDDAEIEAGWLEALVQTADSHPEAGAIGGKVLYPDGFLQDAGQILWRDASTSPPWISKIPGEAPPPEAFDRLRAVDYCGTSSLLIKTSAWDAVGGLDERFYPVYYVDVNLGMALRREGWVVLYQPGSRIRHHRGASTSNVFRSWVSERNRRRFVEKWASELEAHEPPPLTDAAIRRAMAGAEAFAEACRGRSPVLSPAPLRRPPFDAAKQEQSVRKENRRIQRAYTAYWCRRSIRSLFIRIWNLMCELCPPRLKSLLKGGRG